MPRPSGVVSVTSAAWPNRGLGRGTSQPRPRAAASAASQPMAPRHRIGAQSRCAQLEVALEPRRAGGALGRGGLVGRRRAAHGGDDPDAGERLPVARGDRRRQCREAGAVQRGVEDVARRVAGEHPTGAVGAVRRRGEAHEQHVGVGVAERRAGTPPVAAGRRTRHAGPCGRRPHATGPGEDRRGTPRSGPAAPGCRRHRPPAGAPPRGCRHRGRRVGGVAGPAAAGRDR